MRKQTQITALVLSSAMILAGPAGAMTQQLTTKTSAMMAAASTVGKFLISFVGDYTLSKVVDQLLSQGVDSQLTAEKTDLVAEINKRVKDMDATSGERRAVLQEQLDKVEVQVMNVDRAMAILRGKVSHVETEVSQLRTDQAELEHEIDALERRTSALEKRVGGLDRDLGKLDARVSDLELALISECLDLRSAPRLGVEGFRVQGTAQGVLEDSDESEHLSLTVRGYLNSCSGDLTKRGLLLQLSWVTTDLDQDMALYATFKHIEQGGFDPVNLNNLSRLEYPLYRPVHRIDGQVLDVFIPYSDIPFPSTHRLALALVVTHDGEVLYSLADRVINCNVGQRMQCRWGR